MNRLPFHLTATDPSGARAGRLVTPHGEVETPCFMPVGTQGAVKALTPRDLESVGARLVLANTYHLHLRPGEEVVRALGGLHRFTGWAGPMLTDSGGFQAYSLAGRSRVDDAGVSFRSHVDGRALHLGPEDAVRIQEALGADIAMCLDHCPAWPCGRGPAEEALERTLAWAGRSRAAHRREDQALFGIVQGSVFADLRARGAADLASLDLDGYALGGLSVGEPPALRWEVLAAAAPSLPAGRPRYLMGLGPPADLLEGIALGLDLFDCVVATRNARHAGLFTADGPLHLQNARHREDPRPVEEGCDCYTCGRFSRAYLRHLFAAGEMTAATLATIHNLRHFLRLMEEARHAIRAGRFEDFRRGRLARLRA
ncbi:MAG: tRNA guanosine(34) transglycosylase Tgt [Planctomycetes bacterium]|nr:tRNA guanosine(34) transglycosylase Tgt [Planctomycetota bacterium]